MSKKADTVLITGGAGFIGTYFTRHFINHGYQVYVIDDLSTGDILNLPDSDQLVFIQGSILEEETFNDLPEFKYVIHLAAVVGMKLAKNAPDSCYRVSVEGLNNVMELTRSGQYLILSSSAVYGLSTQDQLLNEEFKVSEAELLKYDGNMKGYASGKFEQEQLAQRLSGSNKRVIVIRPFNVVGIGQSAQYGMVLPSFLKSALVKEILWVYDDGRQTRCFSEVGTFVNYSIQVLENLPESSVYEIFNLGNDRPTYIIDLAREIVSQTGRNSKIAFKAYSDVYAGQQDVRSRIPDTSKVSAILGEMEWPDIKHIVSKCIKGKEKLI